MKAMSVRLLACALAAGAAFAGNAAAQSAGSYPDPGRDRYYGDARDDDRYDDGDYDYAPVVRVDPIIGRDDRDPRAQAPQRCYYRRSGEVHADGDRDYRSGGYDQGDDGYRGNGETGRTLATVVGGIAGAVLGSHVGDGGGRLLGTAVGTAVGGLAGQSVYDSAQRQRRAERGTVRVCDPVPAGYDDEELQGYDVTYEYGGRLHHARTDYHPGDRIRVRVVAD